MAIPIKYPDYSNSIVNLACSVLKYYGAEFQPSNLFGSDFLLFTEQEMMIPFIVIEK